MTCAVVVGCGVLGASVAHRLAERGIAVTRRTLASGELYVTAPRRGVAPLYWDHEQLLSLGLPP